MIKAVLPVESPRHHVFSILTDYARYPEWVPGCRLSTVQSSAGPVTEAEIVIQSMKTMTLGMRFEAQPVDMLSFRMIRGKDVKTYAGSYRLMESADGKGTVLVAELEIDAGAMVPKFMVDRIVKKALEDTGSALKDYARRLPASAVPAVKSPVQQLKAKRPKRILRVVKTPAGHRIWLLGQSFAVTPESRR